MSIDQFGNRYFTADETCELLYARPESDIATIEMLDPEEYTRAVREMVLDWSLPIKYTPTVSRTIEDFDRTQQTRWFMPDAYKNIDIAQFVLDLCNGEAELQRVGQELLLFQERDMFDFLRMMKYIVDVCRENSVVLGVGRGSSVASFVLYLLGVHQINSLHYDLDIAEFLK